MSSCLPTGYKAQIHHFSRPLQQSCEADEESEPLRHGVMGPELGLKVKHKCFIFKGNQLRSFLYYLWTEPLLQWGGKGDKSAKLVF